MSKDSLRECLIKQWKEDVRAIPGRTKRHSYIYIENPYDPLTWISESFRKDSLGRVRHVPGDSGELQGSKYPDPMYGYGYPRAVAREYETLIIDLVFYPRPWHEEARDLADGLVVWDRPCGPYERLVRHHQSIADTVRRERPYLMKFLEPTIRRHGLDSVPWGEGWFAKNFVAEVISIEEPPGQPTENPPRAQRRPCLDALLLYIHLTRHLNDGRAREIVKPVLDLDHISDPLRKIQAIKAELDISCSSGRPTGRSPEDSDEVYKILERAVPYIEDRLEFYEM